MLRPQLPETALLMSRHKPILTSELHKITAQHFKEQIKPGDFKLEEELKKFQLESSGVGWVDSGGQGEV
jgi:hypothetical protein